MKKIMLASLGLLLAQHVSAEQICIENVKPNTEVRYSVIVKKSNNKPDVIRVWQSFHTKFFLEFSKNKKDFKDIKTISYLNNSGLYVNLGSLDKEEYASKCESPVKIGNKKSQYLPIKTFNPTTFNLKVNKIMKVSDN